MDQPILEEAKAAEASEVALLEDEAEPKESEIGSRRGERILVGLKWLQDYCYGFDIYGLFLSYFVKYP